MRVVTMRVAICLLMFTFAIPTLPVPGAVSLTSEGDRVILENDLLRIRVNPNRGGLVDSYLVKATGRQLIGEGCFMLSDHFWQQNWPGEFLKVPYETNVVSQTQKAVTLEMSAVSQGWNGNTSQNDLKVIRRITLKAGSPVLLVEIVMQNIGQMGRVAGYWNQNILYAGGRKEEKQLYFRPAIRGVTMATYDSTTGLRTVDVRTSSDFVHNVQQGWMAALGADSHSGLAFVMKYDELMFLYNCLGQFTSEWQYKAVGIPKGKAWKTDFVVVPIAGLSRVDYASRRLVAAVEPDDANGKLTVHLKLAAADTKLEDVTVSGDVLVVRQPEYPPTSFTPQQIATIGAKPKVVTFQLPHAPSEPLALRFAVKGKAAGHDFEEPFETWYGAGYGRNWQVDGSPLYVIPSPERKVTFLKPDVIEKVHNDNPRVLFCKGVYFDEYLPSNIFETNHAEVTSSYLTSGKTWPVSLSYFPASYEELMALDVIALVNIDAVALGGFGQEMLKDFVTHGGTLIYAGDLWAYGQGNLGNGPLAELLPVTFPSDPDRNGLRYLKDQSVRLKSHQGNASRPLSKNAVVAYAGDTFTVKDGAQVILTCVDAPVLVGWKVGEGRVFAITGTVLGEAPNGAVLFHRTPEWSDLMSKMLR